MSQIRIPEKYADCDFCGWATRNDIRCTDGRTIRQDAFAADDGKKVPIVWQHQHDDPTAVLGHGYLENTPEGVRVYGYLNGTDNGKEAKELIEHKDITSLSIWANKLREKGGDVLHGSIKEVSLVLAGANSGAYIDYPSIAHGEDEDIEAYIYVGEDYEFLAHSANSKKKEEEEEDEEEPKSEEKTEEEPKAEEKSDNNEEEKKEMADGKEKTVEDVINTMTDEQKKVMYYLVGAAAAEKEGGADEDEDDDEVEHSDYMEEDSMHFNAFDTQAAPTGMYLSHSDEETILAAARKCGSFKQAMNDFMEENELMHADGDPKAVSGFNSYPLTAGTGVEALFPEFHDVRPGAPEVVTDDLGWVKQVLNKVHKSPFSRIRTAQVDVRGIEEIRARGYKKGKEKVLAGQYAVAKRTTDPQTVYVRSALNHDDIVDITDFDYVDYQYKIDRMQLENELARAILIGDGRDDASEDKISPNHVRNIWQDNSLYTIRKTLVLSATANGNNTADNFGTNYRYAQAMEEALLDAKIDYRGTGSADMFCQQQFFNKMMLAKDLNGRRLYQNKNELATALDVNNVYNVPDFANKTRTEGGHTYRLLAIIGNLADYSLGSTKGGEIIHRTQFDIDFNQEKSLIETRVSGATTRIYSFIVIEEEVGGGSDDDEP